MLISMNEKENSCFTNKKRENAPKNDNHAPLLCKINNIVHL
ncbi:Hypothetical protein PAU_03151 [Photorhabdus asymbiotica]|uniref:Uncharacterized protein n=1 Tax=Photorhabdus asymbiotica subsp. asymbiotica (strain ATCC 43949 / 3105-77) TaxID=553480 RepID=C7BH73_PHOAA|nr:Hypothetical protein PAU_03151 [Photorhabdus asymbiotica]